MKQLCLSKELSEIFKKFFLSFFELSILMTHKSGILMKLHVKAFLHWASLILLGAMFLFEFLKTSVSPIFWFEYFILEVMQYPKGI